MVLLLPLSTTIRDSFRLGVVIALCLLHSVDLLLCPPSVCCNFSTKNFIWVSSPTSAMVTFAQLKILQSLITSLISTVSSSVNVKLDDSNYLTWHFQMELLLNGHGLMGFVDGSHACPPRFGKCDGVSTVESDDFNVWKMHDRALMQLLTATLSPSAVSCAIRSTSACDLWVRLKEQFSIVTRAMIFQMKSELQNIKKGTDSISQYLQHIKEARDYLFTAGVQFDDDDIVILTLNGIPSEYNTLRSII